MDEQKQINKSALELETYPGLTGTLLSIKTAAIQSASENLHADGRVYFALRVYLDRKTIGALLYQVRPLGRDFQGAYEAIECIDFHFNDRSRLPLLSTGKFAMTRKMRRLILQRQRFRPYCQLIPTFQVAAFPGIKANY